MKLAFIGVCTDDSALHCTSARPIGVDENPNTNAQVVPGDRQTPEAVRFKKLMKIQWND